MKLKQSPLSWINQKTNTMKKQILLLLLMLVGFGAQAQNLEWIDLPNYTLSSSTTKSSVTVDMNGNSYTIITRGGSDFIVSRFDPSGVVIWTHEFTTPSSTSYVGLSDKSIVVQGNEVFVTGVYEQSVHDGPAITGFPLLSTSVGNAFDTFIIKLRASDGKRMSAINLGTPVVSGSSPSASIAISGVYIYVTSFSYVAKLNTSLTTLAWNINTVASNISAGNNRSIVADGNGNAYVIGDNGTIKVTTTGIISWTKPFQGSSITVDNLGVYITGDFVLPISFPTVVPTVLTSSGATDIYVAKLNDAGGTIWAKKMGGTTNDTSSSIAIDAEGSIYTTGTFTGVSYFNPITGATNGVLTAVPLASTDGFISRLDNDGNFVSVKQISEIPAVAIKTPNSIAINAFGVSSNKPNIHLVGDYDNGISFIAKYSQCAIITITPTNLANGVLGTNYNQTLSQIGLTGTPTWSISVGTLPPNLTLNAAGVISGIPTATGTYTFTVQVTNGTCKQTKQYTLVVFCPTITINPLPNGYVCAPYTQQMSQSGLSGTVIWSVSGILPTGVTLNTTTGQLNGTPTATGTFNFTISASRDSCNGVRNYAVVISCAPAPIVLTFPEITENCVGREFSTNVTSSNPNAGIITYVSSDISIAVVDSNGDMSIVGTGYVCITALQIISGGITGVVAQRCFEAINCKIQTTSTPKNEVNLYPNPTNGVFEVEFTKSMGTLNVEVANAAGTVVLKETFTKKTVLENANETIKLDISALPAGLYLVKWNNGTTSGTKKVVKR